MPPPAPAIGAIATPTTIGGLPSAPLNIGMGMGAAAGSNAFIGGQFGIDVSEVAFGINLIFQQIKAISWFDRNRWWPLVVVVLGVAAFMILTQGDYITATLKGFAAAFQSTLNYHSFRIAGVNVLPKAPDLEV